MIPRFGMMRAATFRGASELRLPEGREPRNDQSTMTEIWGYFYLYSHLKGFDGMENICECRRGCRRYSGNIRVVNIVIAVVKQIQKFERDAQCVVNFTTDFRVDQRR